MIFEAVLKGFDGADDNTDHLVKWIYASSRENAMALINLHGWELDHPLEEITDLVRINNEDIDLFE